MAWYDVVSWESDIRRHTRENTHKALIRELCHFCTTCSVDIIECIIDEFAHLLVQGIPDDDKVRRIAVFVYLVCQLMRNEHYMSFRIFEYIQQLVDGLRGIAIYRDIVDRYQSYVKGYLTHHVPLWYAKALKDGKLPVYHIDEYRNSRYGVDMKSVNILRGMPVFDEWMVCVYNTFEDGDEYRELLHGICAVYPRTPDDIRFLISKLTFAKVEHLGVEEWMLFARQMGYNTLMEFVMNSGIRGDFFAASSIPLEELLAVINGAREVYYNDDQATIYAPDARELGDIADDDSEQWHVPVPEKFYNPKSLARGISRRPDITYDHYETVLRTLPWWVEPSPEPYAAIGICELPISQYGDIDAMFIGGVLSTQYESVFRDFIDNLDKWGDNLVYCRESMGGTRGWNNLCMLLSTQVFLTLDDVKNMPMIDWDWEELSRNPSIATPENILANEHLPWVWGRWGISKSPGITPEFVMTHWENGINFGISIERDELGGTLSSNHHVVTQELIDSLPDMPWYFGYAGIAENPNITLPWFLKMIDVREWDMQAIVVNVRPDDDLAVRAIQAWWRIIHVKRRCALLAKEVEEWWYSPDCKPASKMRETMFWENHRECV